MPPFELRVPATEAEALAEIGQAPARDLAVLAGGTDLLLDLDEHRIDPRRVISLRRLPWNTHRWVDGSLIVGSTEPLTALEADPAVASRLPALAQAIAAVGGPALRRQATTGGNLGRAAPASDLTPALLALDAEVELLSRASARRVPIDAFLRGSRVTALEPGELIRSVRVLEARPTSAYLWQRVRPANDISQVGVVVAYSPSDRQWRVGLGGAPPRPVLAPDAASELSGPRPTAREVAAAAARLAEHPSLITDRRASDEHRRRLASVLCSRALGRATASPGGPA